MVATPRPTAVRPRQKVTRSLPVLGLVFGGIVGLCGGGKRMEARLLVGEETRRQEVICLCDGDQAIET